MTSFIWHELSWTKLTNSNAWIMIVKSQIYMSAGYGYRNEIE